MAREVVIVAAVRTPIAAFQGALASLTAPQLGAVVIKAAIERAGLKPEQVEQVIMGNVLTAGVGQAPARQAARGAGLPDGVPCVTVNKVCGSGLQSVVQAYQAIVAGDADVIVAGGQESMTNAPYISSQLRGGARMGHVEFKDSMMSDGLTDAYDNVAMGVCAEQCADTMKISRAAQDEFAAHSHRKAEAATAAGKFDAEKFTVQIPQRKADPIAFTTDETIRPGMTADSISGMRPAFAKDGTVTAANASAINDGASALIVMSADKAKALGCKPLARITAYATGGCAPEWVMMAPEHSITACAKKLGMRPTDFDLHEINEAFSAAAVALMRKLELDSEKVNVNGGAVALGHPIGASGARVLTTLLYAMQQKDARTGMASLCLGGGNAVSLAVERIG